MAKITHYIGEISGKLGGQVYARNKAGSYVKNFVSPTNPKSTAQMIARANFTAQVTGWHALSDAVKQQWNLFAAQYFSPKYPGQNIAYSGFNAFVSLNNQLKNIDFSGSSAALTGMTATYENLPTYNGTPPSVALSGKIKLEGLGPGGTDLESAIVMDGVSFVANTGVATATFQTDGQMTTTEYPIFEDPASGEDLGIILMASLPGTQTQEFAKGPKYRLFGVLAHPTVSVGPAAPTNVITVPFTTYDLGYKFAYLADQAVTFTAFLVGTSGQTKLLGSARCVAS